MGLCKCPKKKVTNLFCFEHRVNVCEHCLVANHSKCIVQSYLQWLQDSDYSPDCSLCSKSLSDETCGECVRLACYDVFHFACLNQYAQQLPANTAPAGYTCPTCKAGIFPPSNLASPVADNLREILAKVNWARSGLGLPLIEETETLAPPPPEKPTTQPPNGSIPHTETGQEFPVAPVTAALTNLSTLGSTPAPNSARPSAQVSPYTSTPSRPASGPHTSSVINVDIGTNVRGQEKHNSHDPRKLFDTTKEDLINLSHDHDDDKYKRRPAMDWLNRWLRSRDTNPKRGMKKDPMTVRKKFLIVLLIGVIGFLTMIVIFSKLGRDMADDDPFLDPMANPNIRVHEDSGR